MKLRNHELSLVLSRHLNKYENNVLYALVDEISASLLKFDKDIEGTLSNIENNFKMTMLDRIKVLKLLLIFNIGNSNSVP